MSNIVVGEDRIRSMSDLAIGRVYDLERAVFDCVQTDIPVSHIFHAGLYSRTIMIPKGVLLTGALIKISTLLIISGEVIVYIDSKPVKLSGYNVFPAASKRKQAFLAITDTYLTMIFKTNSRSTQEAEEEFTDESHLLSSRRLGAKNDILITEDE